MPNISDQHSWQEDGITSSTGPQHTFLALPRVKGPSTPTRQFQRSRQGAPVNPYHILQIRKDATHSEMEESYKRLALWHHPGRRRGREGEDLSTKYQVFELLAACYETLLKADSRRRYDNICREVEQSKFQSGVKGAMFVGGKPMVGSGLEALPLVRTPARGIQKQDSIPNLSRASTQSFDSDDGRGTIGSPGSQVSVTSSPSKHRRMVAAARTHTSQLAVSLVDNGSSSDEEEEEEAETHFTQATTHRLFGGPRAHLYKARNFEPFRNPYDVFEEVFGSKVFPRVPPPLGHELSWATSPSAPQQNESSASWQGSTETSLDGKTTVFVTSRILNDRRLVRTETVTTVAPGVKKTHVTVESEPLIDDSMDDFPSTITCLICQPQPKAKGSDSSIDGWEEDLQGSSPICGDICDLVKVFSEEMQMGQYDLYENWLGIFSQTGSFFPTEVH